MARYRYLLDHPVVVPSIVVTDPDTGEMHGLELNPGDVLDLDLVGEVPSFLENLDTPPAQVTLPAPVPDALHLED